MSAINKFTPGRWRVFESMQDDGIEVVADDGRKWKHWSRYIVASVAWENTLLAEVRMNIGETNGYQYAQSVEEFNANVALFANSKRLYYALKALLDHIDNPSEGMLEEAEAALKAARGEAEDKPC